MMEIVIKKAIVGGWTPHDFHNEYSMFYEHWLRSSMLDPLFWQALGKACDWRCDLCKQTDGRCEVVWREYALRFHEINLRDGWDIAVRTLIERVQK